MDSETAATSSTTTPQVSGLYSLYWSTELLASFEKHYWAPIKNRRECKRFEVYECRQKTKKGMRMGTM